MKTERETRALAVVFSVVKWEHLLLAVLYFRFFFRAVVTFALQLCRFKFYRVELMSISIRTNVSLSKVIA